jgi:hypothetical protein
VMYIDVAKVDRDVEHVVMVIHVCFKYVFQMLSVSDECYKCFIWMLHMQACYKHMFQVFSGVSYVRLRVFHLDIAYVRRFRKYFISLFQVYHLSSFVCCNCCMWMF